MKFRTPALIKLLLLEAISPASLKRIPEPSAIMDNPASVSSFHNQGGSAGVLTPIYQLNALECSHRLRKNGTLLDLGSGSGQFLIYLAQRRPDIKIIGLELSPQMVQLGRQSINAIGLDESINLRTGDMTNFSSECSEKIDLISSVFSLHHLPGHEAVADCLHEIARVRARNQCGVWIFDHVRPRHRNTARIFPQIFSAYASEQFKADSRNSLMASWSFRELCKLLDQVLSGEFRHCQSRLLRLYQAHWLPSSKPVLNNNGEWQDAALLPQHQRQFRQLRTLFDGLR